LQEPALSGAEGVGGDAACDEVFFLFQLPNPLLQKLPLWFLLE
jgi:hypothetical protein